MTRPHSLALYFALAGVEGEALLHLVKDLHCQPVASARIGAKAHFPELPTALNAALIPPAIAIGIP